MSKFKNIISKVLLGASIPAITIPVAMSLSSCGDDSSLKTEDYKPLVKLTFNDVASSAKSWLEGKSLTDKYFAKESDTVDEKFKISSILKATTWAEDSDEAYKLVVDLYEAMSTGSVQFYKISDDGKKFVKDGDQPMKFEDGTLVSLKRNSKFTSL